MFATIRKPLLQCSKIGLWIDGLGDGLGCRVRLGFHDRHANRDGRSFAKLAFDRHLAPVELGKCPDQRQTKTGAPHTLVDFACLFEWAS